MLTPEQVEARLDRILLKVQKPGRYVGGELNSVVKDWETVRTRVAFVFPDLYDIGVSNVGLHTWSTAARTRWPSGPTPPGWTWKP
jgi:hypothetical protein